MLFPEMSRKALKAHQEEGMVDMVMEKDNLRWQPKPVLAHPGSGLLLMRTEFTPRYIVENLAELGKRNYSPD
jgi:hypothetical protein